MFDVFFFFQMKYGHFPSEPRRWREKPWEPCSSGLTVGAEQTCRFQATAFSRGSLGGWEVRLGGGEGDTRSSRNSVNFGTRPSWVSDELCDDVGRGYCPNLVLLCHLGEILPATQKSCGNGIRRWGQIQGRYPLAATTDEPQKVTGLA